ncbi:MAG: DUF2752 domain-containing protein [Thermoanaerobaculum sp.]|nr:DUF2752 domain-containing protein [Thermoanaerobaculum sp.]
MKRLLPLLLWLAGTTAAFATRSYLPLLAELMPPCPFRTFTGLPCPSCGSTRAALALSQGQWKLAWTGNPLFTATMIGGAVLSLAWAVVALAGMPLPQAVRELERRWPFWLRLAAALALVANWIWLFLKA